MISRTLAMLAMAAGASAAGNWSNSDLESCLCWDEEKNNWCKGDDTWKQCEDYWNTYAPYVLVALFGGGLLLVGCITYYVMRCLVCCNKICCKGSCHNGVTKSMLFSYKYSLFMLVLVIATLTGLSTHYRKGDVTDGFEAVNDTLTEQTASMITLKDLYLNTTGALLDEVNATNVSTYMVEVTHDITEWMHNINNGQHDFMDHLWILDMFVWPALVTVVLVFIFSLFNLHRVVPEIMVFFVAISCLCVFVLQFTSGAVTKATHDACDDYDNVADSVIDIIDTKIGGCNESGRLGGIINGTVEIEKVYVTESCAGGSTLYSLCEDYFRCDVCSSLDGVSQVISSGSKMTGAAWGCDGCTVEQCSTGCTEGSAVREMAEEVVARDGKVREGLGVLKEKLYPVADCRQWKVMMLAGQDAICKELKPNLDDYFGTVLAAGIFVMFVFVLTTLGNIMYPASESSQASLHVYTAYPTATYADEETALSSHKPGTYSAPVNRSV